MSISPQKLVLAIVFSIYHILSLAQESPGGRATGLAGSAIALEDVWSGFHNQAGLTGLKGVSAGAFYESRFGLSELGTRGLVAALPLNNSAFAISYHSFGYSAFNHSRASLAYALKMSEKFSAGIQLNYHSIRLGENYGNQQTMTFEGGFLYKMSEKLTLAGHINNPTRSRLADFNDERMPARFRLGGGYKFSDKLQLLGEVRKLTDSDATLRLGLEYKPIEQIALRGGFGSEPAMYSFGFGWILKNLQIDAAAGFHQILGFTPHLSLTYKVDEK